MKLKMKYGAPGLLFCALGLAGCPEMELPDTGPLPEDTGAEDGGRRDAGRDGGRADSGPRDAGTPIDMGVGNDAGSDTGVAMDDTGVAADSGVADDAAVEPDAHVEVDAHVEPDAHVEVDAPLPDAFVVPPDAFMRVAGDLCGSALTMPVGATMGTTVGALNDYGSGTGCSATGVSGADIVYAVDVPAGQRATVTVTPIAGQTADPSINLVAGPAATCGGSPRTCLAGDDTGALAAVNTASYFNSTGSTETIYAVIDSGSLAGGTFAATLSFSTPPTGDICGTATTLAAGTTMGTTVGANNDYASGTSCVATAGADVTYAVVVPPGQRATVTVTPGDAMFNPSISLVGGPAATCGGSPRVCLAGDDSGGQATVNTVGWTNTSAAPVTIYAVVDAASSTVTGPFAVNLSFATPPAGDVCATAPTITPGTTTGTTVGASNDYGSGTGCTGVAGRDTTYAIEVPAGQRLTATVTPTSGTFDPSINIMAGPAATCGGSPRVCLAGADSGAGGAPDTVRWRNTSASATTVYIAIDNYQAADAGGAFTLTTALDTPPPSNDSCAAARVVPAGAVTTFTGEDTATGGPRFAETGCGSDDPEPSTLYYAVTVPANSTTLVRATSSIDLVLSSADSCAATMCSANVDSSSSGAETLTLTNSTAAPVSRIITVRGYEGEPAGLVDITFTTAAIPVVPMRSAIPAACVDMTGASAVSGVTSDDSVSSIAALPFSVSYFGTPMTHFSVSSNGFVQLWPGMSGSPVSAFGNVTMPNSSTPNGVVAPFWDDLRPNSGANVLTQTTGAAGSRIFTVQWTNWRATGSGTEALTFQAQFVETSSVIEFHYCTITPGASGTEHSGSSATIGLENATGTVAALQSFNTANAVMTGSGFRFTP